MNEMNTDVVFRFEMLRQVLGTIDRTVLSSGTAERDLKIRKITFHKALYVVIHETIDRIQEGEYFSVLFEKINHRLIQSRQGFVLVVFAGVMGRAAVEYITATIARFISRNAPFKGE